MEQHVTVVKVGGAVVEDEEKLNRLLADFSRVEGVKVLVHGGGRSATTIAGRIGTSVLPCRGHAATFPPVQETVFCHASIVCCNTVDYQ